ncbi:MAG: flagellar hook-length control protein FliK [Bacteroidetes bacterium]|nr:MAG: flagellar hook-length control protein FliK [Bacteroidota bacterium]
MADSISILKGSLKPGVIQRPSLQIDKTVGDYFERSLKERINDYDSANSSPLTDNYADNTLNNQPLSYSANNYNHYERNDYNTSYSEKDYRYEDDKSSGNGSGSKVLTDKDIADKNSVSGNTQKIDASKNGTQTVKKSEELTANNNQKINSKQVDVKPESMAEQKQNVKIHDDVAAKMMVNQKSFSGELQILKDGKTNISNLIINRKTVDISVQKNMKLSEKLKAATDATTLKLNTGIEKTESNNLKIQPGIITNSTEVMQEIKQADASIKTIEQNILNNKDITGLFIKQNEAVSKNQVLNKVDSIAPNLNNIGKEKIAENLKNNANLSENNILPKEEKVQIPSAKFSADYNSQSNFNLSRTGITDKIYNMPKISAKEIDLTNTVGLTRFRLEEIADKTLQVAKNLQNNTTYTARLNLNPPSLGTVSIEITMKDDIAKLVMKTDSREVAKNLENQLIQLKDKLNQQGIKTESIKIEIRNVENDLNDKHAFFEGSNARHKDGKANREFIGTLNQLSREEDELVAAGDGFEEGLLINTSIL